MIAVRLKEVKMIKLSGDAALILFGLLIIAGWLKPFPPNLPSLPLTGTENQDCKENR